MIPLSGPYRPRPIRFVELWECDGWRVKVYGISARGEQPPTPLIEAAKALARERLPRPAVTDERYGLATLIVHAGADGDYVLVDWWFGENMLQHHVYAGPQDAPERLAYVTPEGVGCCVWELAVLGFERQAWIDAILAQPAAPRIDEYLARRLNADV